VTDTGYQVRDKRQLGAASAEVHEVIIGLEPERQYKPSAIGHRQLDG
jgi:hypothetical protein